MGKQAVAMALLDAVLRLGPGAGPDADDIVAATMINRAAQLPKLERPAEALAPVSYPPRGTLVRRPAGPVTCTEYYQRP
jgi:hypothetical protein